MCVKIHIRLLAAFLALMFIVALPSGSSLAQDTQDRLVIDSSREAIISGFVKDVYYNTFTIQNDRSRTGPPITVSLRDIDIGSYNNLDKLINDGMRVTVYGRLVDGNTIEASRIVRE